MTDFDGRLWHPTWEDIERDESILFRPNTAATIDDTRTWVDPKGHRLSDRIWLARAADRAGIEQTLRGALASGEGPERAARRLSVYQTPAGQEMRFRSPRAGMGNYAARRLSRTEHTRAFGEATKKAALLSPFITGLWWRLSGAHIDVDECNSNARRHSRGMEPGQYTLDDLPRYPNHPNELCTLSPVTVDDQEALRIARQIAGLPDVAAADDLLAIDPTFGVASADARRRAELELADLAGVGRSPSGMAFDPAHPPAHILADEDALRPLLDEQAIVYDRTGAELFRTQGAGNAVEFSDAEMARMQDALITHNHPLGWNSPEGSLGRTGNSFSKADIEMVIETNAAGIRAVTPTRRFTMERPAEGWGITPGEYRAAAATEDQGVRATFTNKIQTGEMTVEQAEADHFHELMTRMSDRFGWRYVVTEG